jgi:hypothetical protein
MTQNLGSHPPSRPGLTRFDDECIERLVKAGHLATAAKLYRFACHCSAKEAELAISGRSS